MKRNLHTKFYSYLNEGHFRQNYYHYTNYDGLLNIIEDNEIKRINTSGISLTRDKNLHKHTDYLPTSVRLELNGDLLTNNYKIKSYLDTHLLDKEGSPMGKVWKGNPKLDYDFVEFEERLYSDKINPLSKYLESIYVSKDLYTDLKDNEILNEYIDNYNIEIDYLN